MNKKLVVISNEERNPSVRTINFQLEPKMLQLASKPPVKASVWCYTLLVLLLLESCAVSNSVVSRHTSDKPGRAHHLSNIGPTHWSYLWGLLKAEDWAANCQSGSDMTRVRTVTNPLFIIISFLSLGIVIPQRLEWDCAPPARETGTIGDD